MYLLTLIICKMGVGGLKVNSEEALKEITSVMTWIFTPINAMIVLGALGNVFGKVKDEIIDTSKAGKRIIILLIIFIVMLIFETNYIAGFIQNLLG